MTKLDKAVNYAPPFEKGNYKLQCPHLNSKCPLHYALAAKNNAIDKGIVSLLIIRMVFPYLMMLHPWLIHGLVWPGKLGEGPILVPSNSESNPTISDNQPLYQQASIQRLQQATPGSAGLDLRSTSTTILTSDSSVICLSMGVYGPLLKGHWASYWARVSPQCRG